MATITNSNTINTEFAPAAGNFRFYNTGPVSVRLSGADATGGTYAILGEVAPGSAVDLTSLAGNVYKWTGATGAAAYAGQ